MTLTVPLGRRSRLTVALSRRCGLRVAAWEVRPCLVPPEDDGPAAGGVREPRVPRPPQLGGAAARALGAGPS